MFGDGIAEDKKSCGAVQMLGVGVWRPWQGMGRQKNPELRESKVKQALSTPQG
jgi:hypothetical protein